VAAGQRFDYPLDYTAPVLPEGNVDVSFQIAGHDPTVLGSIFSFAWGTSATPQLFRDGTLSQGLATSVMAYGSYRYPQLVFTSVTGGNAVVQADPALLGAITGVVSYK
jgi:hypothetical protein